LASGRVSGQRLDIGEHGDVRYREKLNGRVAASVYFRNAQGVRKRIEATGDSKASARRRLFATLGEAMAAGGPGYSPRSTFADVAADWLESLDELVAAGRRSPRTVALYRHALARHVLPGLGGLRLSELTSARMDRFIRDRRRAAGYSVAKLCRSVTSGICAFAVRRDAMRHNPVRDVEALERPSTQEARALTDEECRGWLMILDGSELARQADLPDLVRFLLGTGCRIGEALALTWPNVDLERHLINIDSTLVRVKGQGLLIKRPKTKSSIRVLRVPLWLVEILRERRARDPESQGAVFPDSVGGHRDPNNVERDHRRVRRGTPVEWVVPHTYRKTVATMLDRQGLSARTIADQLGHARISMTQDVYMGRRAVDQAAVAVLEGISPRGHDGDDEPPAVLSVVV
jgi:integrase